MKTMNFYKGYTLTAFPEKQILISYTLSGNVLLPLSFFDKLQHLIHTRTLFHKALILPDVFYDLDSDSQKAKGAFFGELENIQLHKSATPHALFILKPNGVCYTLPLDLIQYISENSSKHFTF